MPGIRDTRRSGRVLLAGMALLLAACTAGSAVTQRSITPAFVSYDGPVPTPALPGQQVATHLPKGVQRSIRTSPGDAPGAVSPGFGSIWVPSHRGTTFYRINPTTNRINARIPMPDDCFNVVGAGFGRLFVACGSEEVVDPTTNRVVGTSDCGQYISFSPDAIWSASENGIQRCSPTTYKQVMNFKIGGGYSGTAYGFGSVWAANGLDHSVARIDPSTGKIIASIPADGVPDADFDCHVLVAFGAVWNQCDPSDKVYRIDPSTNQSEAFTIKGSPLQDFGNRSLTAGLGSLWLTTSLSHVTRFDPATMKVLGTYPADKLGGGSGQIAIYDGSLWLTNPEHDTIWRDRIVP
jgi:streptogramin lyase